VSWAVDRFAEVMHTRLPRKTGRNQRESTQSRGVFTPPGGSVLCEYSVPALSLTVDAQGTALCALLELCEMAWGRCREQRACSLPCWDGPHLQYRL